MISEGNVAASGTQEELLKNCELYRKMWEAHSIARDEDEEVLVLSGKEAAHV